MYIMKLKSIARGSKKKKLKLILHSYNSLSKTNEISNLFE